jgi:DNA-binding PucR family transcriptional regulator
MIADVARAIDDFRSLGETLDRICRRVVGLGGADVSALLLPDPDAGALVIKGSAGMSEAYVDHINREHPLRIEDPGPDGLSPTATAYTSGEPVTTANIEDEPMFAAWRGGARLEGYRSLACVPVIVRARVIGVLNCYGRRPHEHTADELELLQLVARMAGVAIETARAAEMQRDSAEELRRLSARLREQNAELARLTAIQSRLAETLAHADVTAVERTAETLAETTGRGVLVWGRGGRVLAFAGLPDAREPMAVLAAGPGLERRLSRQPLLREDGCTILRIGTADAALGALVLRPAIADEGEVAMLAARHAAAVMAGELQGEQAGRMLETYARPAILLALVHGLHGRAQRQEDLGLLQLTDETELRLAVLRCPTPEAAHRLARRIDGLRQSGWPAVAATADGRDTLLLLEDAVAAALAAAAGATRERYLEVDAIGVSDPVRDLEGLADARWRAMVAAATNHETGAQVTLFDELRGLSDVAQRLPPDVARDLAQTTLGSLRAHDATHGSELVATLHAYVAHGGRQRDTAEALHIHPNTLLQRLRRCAELGGPDVRDLRELGRVVLALEWDRLLAAGAEVGEEAAWQPSA